MNHSNVQLFGVKKLWLKKSEQKLNLIVKTFEKSLLIYSKTLKTQLK